MLATQLNDKVTSGELDTFSIIRLNKYLCNEIQKDRSVYMYYDIPLFGNTVVPLSSVAPQERLLPLNDYFSVPVCFLHC